MNNKVFIGVIAILSFTQGIKFDELYNIFKKLYDLNLNLKDIFLTICSLIVFRLFYRGVKLLYSLTNLVEEHLILKFKNKLQQGKKQ